MHQKNFSTVIILYLAILFVASSCHRKPTCHEEMVATLKSLNSEFKTPQNQFYPKAKLQYMDSLLLVPHSAPSEIRYCNFLKANILLELGKEDKAIEIFERISKGDDNFKIDVLWKSMALAYLRKGERSNCISTHAAESCILPIKGMGLHRDLTGSKK